MSDGYSIALLTFGVILLMVGLVGRVKARELEVGTGNRVVRLVTGVIGAAFIFLSIYFIFVPPDKTIKSVDDDAKLDEIPAEIPFQVEVIYQGPQGLELRENPSISGDVIATLRKNSVLTVQGYSREANGYIWWPARIDQGWIAEGDIDESKPRMLEPLEEDRNRVSVNNKVRVTYPHSDGLNLRVSPDIRADIIATLLEGSELMVAGPAIERHERKWWLVEIAQGWIREGPTDVSQPRWLRIVK
jgi:hypothetical protein